MKKLVRDPVDLTLFIYFFSVHCGFRNTITKENGEVFGMYPMLIQSKYRIDDKRPMDKDGKDKKPWSKSTILIDIFKKKFTILNFEKILGGSIFFYYFSHGLRLERSTNNRTNIEADQT